MSGAPENVSSSRNMTSGQGLRIHMSMSVRGTRIALSQSVRPMRTAARPTLSATTAAPRSVCWYSISRPSEDIEDHAIATELEEPLHNWMFFRLRPSSRVDRQYEQFALSDEGCEGVQQLHPRR